MLANHLLLKLILTPMIIAAATLAARRWGENIGGLIVGLPLMSGPVSVFFAIEQGPGFAAGAARGTMLGLIPVAVFCTAYARCSRRLRWYWAAPISIGLYFAAVFGLSFIQAGLWLDAAFLVAVVVAALWMMGRPAGSDGTLPAPWWDLPLRMLFATGLLFAMTSAAGALGPNWSGLISPFPIITFVMAVFSHSRGGVVATWRLTRGVLLGLFACTAFYLVVGLGVAGGHLAVVYGAAVAAALGVNGISLIVLLKRSTPVQAPSGEI